MTKRMSEMAEEIACRPEITQDEAYELLAALKWLMNARWRSVEKDNMEYACTTTTFVLERARKAIEAAERGD